MWSSPYHQKNNCPRLYRQQTQPWTTWWTPWPWGEKICFNSTYFSTSICIDSPHPYVRTLVDTSYSLCFSIWLWNTHNGGSHNHFKETKNISIYYIQASKKVNKLKLQNDVNPWWQGKLRCFFTLYLKNGTIYTFVHL